MMYQLIVAKEEQVYSIDCDLGDPQRRDFYKYQEGNYSPICGLDNNKT